MKEIVMINDEGLYLRELIDDFLRGYGASFANDDIIVEAESVLKIMDRDGGEKE